MTLDSQKLDKIVKKHNTKYYFYSIYVFDFIYFENLPICRIGLVKGEK